MGTYPGPYVPEPVEIVEHFGDSSMQQLSREILSLTKLNWNSATFSCEFPMTLVFAREVGKILSEFSEADAPFISFNRPIGSTCKGACGPEFGGINLESRRSNKRAPAGLHLTALLPNGVHDLTPS